jgi:hypothetical protein
MFTIHSIRYSELKEKFLEECLVELKANLTSEELFYDKKFKTGEGPNRFHFDKIKEGKLDVGYWIDAGHIFQYERQLKNIFKRYEYILNKQGF